MKESGFTLIEMVVVVGVTSILMAIAVVNLNELSNPALNAANEISGFFKQVRARALATTTAYTISAPSSTQVTTTYGTTCSAAQTADSNLALNLQSGASMDSTVWSICFNSRGLPNQNVSVDISDIYDGDARVEVLLGGSVRIQ